MQVGKDYKVISFQGEPERIAALINGDIQGALVSVAARRAGAPAGRHQGAAAHRRLHAARRRHVLDARRPIVEKNPETVKKFIRAIAKGVMYFRDNKAGSIADDQGASRHQDRRRRPA